MLLASWTNVIDMADLCIKCKKEVRKRQEAILCDTCQKWCHKTCWTGIDRSVYRRMVTGEVTSIGIESHVEDRYRMKI